MEGRLIEYRPIGGGLDYHHNSPLIGEIPPAGGDYSHVVHRSIDQLRNSLNDRVALGPLSVFSNSADLRGSVLSYSNQPNLQHHQPQQPSQLQQQQQQPTPSQHQASSTSATHSYHLGNGGEVISSTSGNNCSNAATNDLEPPQLRLVEKDGSETSLVCLETKMADSTTGGLLTTVGGNGASNRPGVGGVSAIGGANNSAHSGVGRGRKSKIFPLPNQHIIVTSNSVDNGGTRQHHRQQQQSQQRSTQPATQHHHQHHHHQLSNDSSSTNGISSSTSSPQHHMQVPDIKDTKIFTSKADLQLHTQIHMREAKPYKCTQCLKAFANSSYLSQHTRIHLGIKPYRCEICQRKFTQLSHLQQHIRTHTGDKPYKCRHPGCQKAFSQLSNLQSHSRCHQTDKPFKCNSCYKCFSDEPSLLDHIPKHKESKHLKTHICQYCGKSYTQETYLSKHMQKHAERTDKRPPITGIGLPPGTTASAIVGGNNIPNTGVGGQCSGVPNRNNLTLPPVTITPSDNTYWPKVSPDSAANMADVLHHQQQQDQQQQLQQQQQQQQQTQQQHQHHQQTHNAHQQPPQTHHQQQQQQTPSQQQNGQQSQQQGPSAATSSTQPPPPPPPHMDYNNHPNGAGPGGTNGSQQQQQQQQQQQHAELQSHHRMNDSGRDDIGYHSLSVSTASSGVGPYDASSITKTTSNSAFTPINSMQPHLNSLSHHPMAQRPYLYDAISFQNKNNVNQNNASQSFPNQLISLHQIRNYAHQPTGLAMAGEHLLGVSVGASKDKG